MAILHMNKITICGLNSQRKEILEFLHKKEIVEISSPNVEENNLSRKDTARNISQFDSYMNSAEKAIAVLDEYAPEQKGLFTNRKTLPVEQYSMKTTDSDVALKYAYNANSLAEEIRTYKESLHRITIKQQELEPYIALDVPMNLIKTKSTSIKTGMLTGEWTSSSVEEALKESELEAVSYQILSATKEVSYIWFAYLTKDETKMKVLLQKIGFVEPSFSLSHRNPRDKIKVLEDEKKDLNEKMSANIEQIKSLAENRDEIKLLYDHLCIRKEKYQVLAQLGLTEHAFFLEGYVPIKYAEEVKKEIEENFTTAIKLTLPTVEDAAPVTFDNNSLVAPVEEITATYSMPCSTDIDPNPIMAFFYYLFFGMMFSDAGYGILLMIVCGYLGFSKRLEKMKRNTFKMFFYCGVSTTFWGFMYGSFFGNIITTVSSTFFHSDFALKPIWLDPVSEPLTLLIFSVALGMVQILVGLGIKFYMLVRQHKIVDAICDVGMWLLVLIGVCILAAGMGVGISALTTIGGGVAIAGGVGLVLTQGRDKKNIFARLMSGIISLYDITGYVSDALSYCRLMALGLATGVIANVVGIMGSLMGASIPGVIMFIVISIAGHLMNFAINMLGAYVHTNRLQYVEFFSKFYEGGGRRFSPFKMGTKYVRFSNDD